MPQTSKSTRRQWLAGVPAAAVSVAAQTGDRPAGRPNIVMVISDQFRWDCVGAMGINPMNLTPNLDAMARKGVLFRSAFCNQPVCAPARASIFTGQYPARHAVWKNGIPLNQDATTLPGLLRASGYSANYIGKWHLGPTASEGPVAATHRGGFLDLWQAANTLEHTSHAYEGDLFDGDGKPLHFQNTYRTDFMTGLAQRFLRAAKSPFLLTLSYLEVHHQNDKDTFDPPKEYAGRYTNPFVPQDLRALPGSWPSQLADYYRCVAKMDETVGTLRKTLQDTGLAENTILMFVSDHACHFKTRNAEYKRSPHESSIHVPLIVEGPGFNRGLEISELVSQVDLTPTLLECAGLPVPATMQGHSVLPLLDRKTQGWRNETYFEMSEFVTGRGLRTPQYTYAVMAPKQPGWKAVANAPRYVEYMLYDNYADPHQQVNLAGRATHHEIASELRGRLLTRMREAGDPAATIEPCWFPYA
ncbi:MAG TPA: sulfatase-like hydrolase/transferase [Candidatus Sulfopaludibacter sp.]|jgi:arylsulfatase A-like enzyme|nr:sulfatase-like hydrolase/transferase [Candidatus Sulfopaludibacter sp.]